MGHTVIQSSLSSQRNVSTFCSMSFVQCIAFLIPMDVSLYRQTMESLYPSLICMLVSMSTCALHHDLCEDHHSSSKTVPQLLSGIEYLLQQYRQSRSCMHQQSAYEECRSHRRECLSTAIVRRRNTKHVVLRKRTTGSDDA